MKNIRPIARVIIINKEQDMILLVRNKGASFWYCPGGGWEYQAENILEAAKREVKEEVGLDVEIGKLVYAQEFHESENVIYFETFWLAVTEYNGELNHVDTDPNGMVEESRWFKKDELTDFKVFPKRLKDVFWKDLNSIMNGTDPFIGVS